MTSASWFLMLVVVAHAFVFHVLPRLSRPDILFAVTVSEAFVAGEGRRWARESLGRRLPMLMASSQRGVVEEGPSPSHAGVCRGDAAPTGR